MNPFNEHEWKREINEFLFTNLPGDTRLDQLELIACQFFKIVEKFYEEERLKNIQRKEE